MPVRPLILAAAVLVMALPSVDSWADAVVADHTIVASFEHIPVSTVEDVKTGFRMFYGHTSHGSQIVTGMSMVRDEDPLFDFNNGPGTFQFSEYSDDLGHNGDVSWVPITRARLDEPGSDINLVMWSWCGGVSDNTEEGINTYLNAMDSLEQDYPDVVFVYMTGHLDGTGPSGNLYVRNNQIRDYCVANDKVLFDFADIESYDPDGVWYPDGGDGCEWCYDWCATHTCPTCPACAHSHCFNCYLKGKAFWWMLGAVISGMDAGIDEGRVGPRLAPSCPNPSDAGSEITFSLPSPADVRIDIYNMRGQKVATLLDRHVTAGDHSVRWDGRDSRGVDVGSGVYFCRVEADGFDDTAKMVLIR